LVNLINKQWLGYCLIGVIVRLAFSQLGFNGDLSAFYSVGDHVSKGGDLYNLYYRWPYFTLYAGICGLLITIQNIIGNSDIQFFHLLVCFVLSLADVGIANWLKKNYSKKIALLFLFNPISILITGFHSQMGNIAVLFGLYAYSTLYSKQQYSWFYTGVWLGLSLSTKHLLVFFLPWFLFAPAAIIPFKKRMYILVLSIVVPLILVLPFILTEESFNGFVRNVIYYNSMNYGSLIQEILKRLPFGNGVQLPFLSDKTEISKIIFFSSMIAIVIRQAYWQNKDSLFIYLIALVGLSNSIADQYFAIPLVAVAIYFEYFELRVFTIYIALWLLLDSPFNVGGVIQQLNFIKPFIPVINDIFKAAVGQLLLIIFVIRILFSKKRSINNTFQGAIAKS